MSYAKAQEIAACAKETGKPKSVIAERMPDLALEGINPTLLTGRLSNKIAIAVKNNRVSNSSNANDELEARVPVSYADSAIRRPEDLARET